MADYHFKKAENWQKLLEAHDRFVEDYNAQSHWAHQDREEDGRRSPRDVLGFYTCPLRYREDDLQRAFFSSRFSRVLDPLGYARFRDWRLYAERRDSQDGTPQSGCSRQASPSNTVVRRSRATTWNSRPTPASSKASVGRGCLRPRTSEAGRS
jgi:hypothetical protein